ncbi:molybdopterin-guanine dinucleotide biosynthesis protein B [Pelomyxa schiedti]|nr:molybdopterin-guanine dinucleotide biosynthesis protein B [Pelomyxa schiedti]
MRRVHFVGTSDSGKTHLITQVISELKSRGVRVGSAKHTPHHFDTLDAPGKDSQCHAAAGASPSAVVTLDKMAVFMDLSPGTDVYSLLEPMYSRCCDIFLVEGDKMATGVPKVEVWRKTEKSEPPLALHIPGIVAIITPNAEELSTYLNPNPPTTSTSSPNSVPTPPQGVQIWPLSLGVPAIADKVLQLL